MKFTDLKSTVYTIYHIPGVKVGCSNDPQERVKKQGFKGYEILERHFDIEVASVRERELQEEYGYPVDNVPYWFVVLNGKSAALGYIFTEEQRYLLSEKRKNVKKTDEHKRKISESIKGSKISLEQKNLVSKVHKGSKWYNNGFKSIKIQGFPPEDFIPGRLYKRKK
jgi:hypothetical protein